MMKKYFSRILLIALNLTFLAGCAETSRQDAQVTAEAQAMTLIALVKPTATPTATSLPTATPTVTPPATSDTGCASTNDCFNSFNKVYISEAFNDNSNEWSVGDIEGDWWVGTRLIQNGVLDWDGVSRRDMISHQFPEKASLQEKLTDAQVSARVNLINQDMNGAYGLTIRSNAETDFYTFLADNNGKFAFFLKVGSDWNALIDWSENPYLKKGVWNKMAIQAVGSHFRLFFNDNLLSEVDDAFLKSGQCGVIVDLHDFGVKIRVQFDDFEVRLPSP